MGEAVAAVIFLALLLGTTLRVATPIAYAAVAATFSERCGVINVGLEGTMLVSAFSGVAASYATGSAWLGVLCGAGAGVVVTAILGFAAITLRANQIVAGMAINILALGATRFGLELVWGTPGVSPSVHGLDPLTVPLLSRIPVFGSRVFEQNALVYLALAAALLSAFVLRRTRFGRHVDAVGEAPGAADAAGLDVRRMRYAAFLVGGLLAGLGGVSLSLGELTYFVQAMVAGRGFIALAANILGRWNALGAYAAALLFGAAEALQLTLQNQGVHVPSQFLATLPYALTLVALAGFFRRSRPPAGLGIPY